jgi:Cu/Ag efflux protein CusF
MPGRRILKWSLSIAVVLAACLIMWLGVRYATEVQAKHYEFNGTVVAVYPQTEVVRVHNQDMPGFMSPMDMDYELKDKKMLSELRPGDVIRATLLSDTRGFWRLENVTIQKTP